MRLHPRTLIVSFVMAAASAAVAGTVNVTFVNESAFSDAGNSRWEEQSNLAALATHLKGLGQRYLRPDQVLNVEVLDVDLAGTVRHTRRADVRVVNGRADWPRINLRYSLEDAGKAVSSGEEMVADMNYSRGMSNTFDTGPLYYEKRMLDRWFKTRIAEGRPATH